VFSQSPPAEATTTLATPTPVTTAPTLPLVTSTRAPLTELNIGFGGGVATLDFVHLHEGEGLVFGPEVTPSMSTPSSGIWTVTPNTVYVLEAHAPGGGFF
jgi:hypothetical protein